MNQEETFKDFYKSLSLEDVNDEINTLANIRLSVDFYEYLITDPEKLLAIIHYNNLEETYGIRIVFDNDCNNCEHRNDACKHRDSCEHCNDCSEIHFSDRTGNMSIIFRFNDDIYRISTMVDSVTNNTIYDSFVEQVQLILNNYKAKIISREEAELKKIEHELSVKHSASVNVMWYVLNSPKNIKDLLENIKNNTFEECIEDTNNVNNLKNIERIKKSEETFEQLCPVITIVACVLIGIFTRYIECNYSVVL